jgi:phage tail sheath gpL-like
MTVSFNQVPRDIRTAGVYAEVSNSMAGNFVAGNRTLIIAQATTAGVAELPVAISSKDQATTQFGAGSHAALMVAAFKEVNPFSELWVLPLQDSSGSVAATDTITISGTPTAPGALSLYIGTTLVQVAVATTDTPTTIAASVAVAVNAIKDLPCTAASALGVVTLTAKNKGSVGNSLQVSINFLGAIAGQALPAGLTVVIADGATGSIDPVISAKLPLINDMAVAFFAHPYADTTSLDAFKTFLANRWTPMFNRDGHAFTARSGTLSALQTFGAGRNDEFNSVIGLEAGNLTLPLVALGNFVGQAALSLGIDPARTLQTLPLYSVMPPKEQDAFSQSTRNTLLKSGISTVMYNGGMAMIQRAITTYQTNAFGMADTSYLDVTTRATLSFYKQSVIALITSKYPRHKLAADGTNFGAGNAVVTPKAIRADLVAHARQLEQQGILQNTDDFEKNIIVELDATDTNRVNVLLPPILVNNLIVTAAKVEFRLNAA